MPPNRPYVVINCAMSVDGKLALPIRRQTRISTAEDMKRVYDLRNQSDAIIVGVNTILADDPGLVVKYDGKLTDKQPLRIVLDTRGRIPEGAEVLDTRAPTLIAIGKDCTRDWMGVDTFICGEESIDLVSLLNELHVRGINKVLVEGGGETLWSFISQKLVDEMFVFMGNMIIGGSTSPTLADGEGAKDFEDIIKLDLINVHKMDGGVLLHYKIL